MNFVSRERLEKAKQMDLLTYFQNYEIYLLDAHKVEPSKWETIIRHPIRKI